MVFKLENSINQKVQLPNKFGVELFIKREDLIHDKISGNKYRKLKYNIKEAKKSGFKTLLSFGGAYSNHIAAVAATGNEFGFKTIGVIRGDELRGNVNENPTLKYAGSCGMQFKFITRGEYRHKTNVKFIESLRKEFGEFYLLPEGGTNDLAVKGCEEILDQTDKKYNYVCCAVGTGGTISGLINCSELGQQILGFPALKGDFLNREIIKFANKSNWQLILEYHFGGYARVDKDLIDFINVFKQETGIPLDPIYTGKMMFGIFDLIKKGYFKKESKILAIHSGGLQGIEGMNKVLIKKDLPLISV